MKASYLIILVFTFKLHVSAQFTSVDWADTLSINSTSKNSFLKTGDTVPNFNIKINGQVRKLKEVIKDNYVYIDFWGGKSEYNSSNKSELRYIHNKFLKENDKYHFRILSIYLGKETDWQQKNKEYAINWLNAVAEDDSCLYSWFDLNELPNGIIIDNKGKLHTTKINSLSEQTDAFDMLLSVSLDGNDYKTADSPPKPTSYNSITELKITGKNPEIYQLTHENDVYIDTLKPVNTIKREIGEPTKITIINANDTAALIKRDFKYIFFYLEQGVNDITIDLDKSTIYSESSKLNNEYNEFWQLKRKYDTIFDRISDNGNKNYPLRTNNNKIDSVSHAYHREKYNKCLSFPKSFITLQFVLSLTDGYLQGGISRKEVVSLFNILDSSLFKYPTYIETKKIIDKNFINQDLELKKPITKPLWNPN